MGKFDFKVSKPSSEDGVKRTVLIALRVTPEERADLAAKLKASGFPSFQEAFDQFIASASPSGALSKVEREYTVKRARSDTIERRLRARRLGQKPVLPILVNLYRAELKAAGHDPTGLSREITEDWEALIGRILKKWPGEISDVLTFKEWIALWKDLFELKRKILDGSVQSHVVAPSPAPETLPTSA